MCILKSGGAAEYRWILCLGAWDMFGLACGCRDIGSDVIMLYFLIIVLGNSAALFVCNSPGY